MAPSGRKPKPPGQAVTRHRRTFDWIEVGDVPHTGGPRLPAKRRDGTAWPAFASDTWDAWSTMPHCTLWTDADWVFALDTLELTSRAFGDDAKASLWAELRNREKVMGTCWSFRQDMRIRYVNPPAAQAKAAGVAVLEQYRDL